MTRRIAAIAFIFSCTALVWMILAGTISARTYSSDGVSRKKVVASWGPPQVQGPPNAVFSQPAPSGSGVNTVTVHPEASRIDVDLSLDQRQKGLLWFSTSKVEFAGTYTFRNPTDQPQKMFVTLNRRNRR